MLNNAENSLRTHLNPKVLFGFNGWRAAAALLIGLSLTCGAAVYASSAAAAPAAASTAAGKRVAANYGKIPLGFEANQGQTDPSVQFLSRGSGYSLSLTQDEVILNLERQNGAKQGQRPEVAPVDTLRMKLLGANPHAAVAGADPQPGVVSYFLGNDPRKSHTGVPTYGKVHYAQVYPGVDLVFYGNQRQLEYDFVVAAGADPNRIAWQIDGAKPAIDADGNLVLTAANGPASFRKPVLYQMDADRKIAVEGAFQVAGDRISVRLGSYDHAKPLIIDPVLTYASYLGGSLWTAINGLALDSEGSIYVTGDTQSPNFPVQNPYESSPYSTKSTRSSTAFITKFSPDGSSLGYSTYSGGSGGPEGGDQGNAIALDTNNEAYVTGITWSNDFPVTAGAYQTMCQPEPQNTPQGSQRSASCGWVSSAFVTKLNSTGTALVYSSFFGRNAASSYGNAIAVDAAGRAYFAGLEDGDCPYSSTDTSWYGWPLSSVAYYCFPTTDGAVISGGEIYGNSAANGTWNSFVAVFDPTGADLLYSSIFCDLNGLILVPLGDDYHVGQTYAYGVTVDSNLNFYMVGQSSGKDLPTTPGVIQPTSGPAGGNPWTLGSWRGFVAKFNPVTATGGASLAYATYLGGLTSTNTNDQVNSVVTDSQDYAYVAGTTNSSDFPTTTGAYQTSFLSGTTSFATKLNPTGTAMEWSTFLGNMDYNGSNSHYQTSANNIQLDGNGNVYIAGAAQNYESLSWLNPVEPVNTGNGDSFVAEIDPTGSKLLFATLLHIATEAGFAVDAAGNMYLGMSDNCGGDIVTPGAFQQTNHMQPSGCGNFASSGYVVKISALGAATVALAPSPSPVATGQSVALTANVTPTATWASVPTGTVAFDNGSTVLGTGALNSSGVATYTTSTSTLNPNTYTLTAVYSGDSTYPTASYSGDSNYAPGFGTASVTVAVPVPAALTSPATSPVPCGSTTFSWTAGVGPTAYWLYLGTTGAGGNNLYSSGSTAALSETVRVPCDGVKLYVRLLSKINGTWISADYTFSEGGTLVLAVLTSPKPGSVLTGSSATFTWTAGSGPSAYWLYLGTTGVGSSNLFSSGPTTALSVPVTNLPANDVTVYARFMQRTDGAWQSTDYIYGGGGPVTAVLTAPKPGTVLNGSAAFTWTSGAGVTAYWLYLGTTAVGASDLYSSGSTTALSTAAITLPAKGATVFARLLSRINGAWVSADYTYTEGGTLVPAAITSPANGSVLPGPSVKFSWAGGAGPSAYWLYLGATGVGSSNLYNSGSTTATSAAVTGLPTTGAMVYAKFLQRIDGAWQTTYYSYWGGTPGPATLTTPTSGTALCGSTKFTWPTDTGPSAYWLELGTSGRG